MGLLKDYCAEHALPFDELGKLVVARDEGERARLSVIEETARGNGVPGLARLRPAGLRSIEPEVAGQGGQVLTGCAVTAIRQGVDQVRSPAARQFAVRRFAVRRFALR